MKQRTLLLVIAGCTACLLPITLRGQARTWTFATPENVDNSARFSSLAVDEFGNLHVAYVNDSDRVKYAFRDASLSKWFSMDVDNRASFTALTLDSQGAPHICYTQRTMHYAYYDTQRHDWIKQEVSPGTGAIAYYCSVGLSPKGIPHLTWYQERTAQDTNYLHMRHAELRDGQWNAMTIDDESQTGKWHTMIVDKQGVPHLSYDSYVVGSVKYAYWNGHSWTIIPIDSRTSSEQPGRGMGNCLQLDRDGRAMISYFEEAALKYAREKEHGGWSIETIASTTKTSTWAAYRSVQVLDSKRLPHVLYEDAGTLRLAHSDGKTWSIQTLVRPGAERLRYASMAIGPDDVIYISYCDPDDGSLKVMIGRAVGPSADVEVEKKSTLEVIWTFIGW
jgi:hypothetical protein